MCITLPESPQVVQGEIRKDGNLNGNGGGNLEAKGKPPGEYKQSPMFTATPDPPTMANFINSSSLPGSWFKLLSCYINFFIEPLKVKLFSGRY